MIIMATLPLWIVMRVRFHQNPCPVVSHLKPEGVGPSYKVTCTSLNKETILNLLLEDDLVEEHLLPVGAVAGWAGGGDDGGVVLLCGGLVQVLCLENTDEVIILLVETVQLWSATS